jgi:hypothetical protein
MLAAALLYTYITRDTGIFVCACGHGRVCACGHGRLDVSFVVLCCVIVCACVLLFYAVVLSILSQLILDNIKMR